MSKRLLVLQPPGVVDFDGNYSAWHAKLDAKKQADAEAERAPKKQQKGQPVQQQQKPKPKQDKGRDNPYARPFGKLSMKDLESQIADTELALAECQQSLGDPGAFREPQRGQKLQNEYDALAKKLEQLEAEYFARET